jgi:glycosyltransferase involved in cell wall biosynthesis
MRIAFVCDWLTGMRGGERCLEALCEIYPKADIFTLVHIPHSVSQTIESHEIRTSYIQRLPGGRKNFRRYLPLFPDAIRRFDLSGYDCALSLSHCVAKGVRVPANIPHICYCHTPMRYAWHTRSEYLRRFGYLRRKTAGFLLDRIRNWDRRTASAVTRFVAVSRNVQNRIKEAYNRDSVIIHPPVDCDRFGAFSDNDRYYLIVSALAPYKRVDLAIEAFNGLDRRLIVVGNGPELPFLKHSASPNVDFVEAADDRQVAGYMQKCRALIFPGEEDFGIVPLEAQAAGKAVIAYGKGGALETVIAFDEASGGNADATGLFFHEQSPKALREAILRFEEIEDRFDSRKCRSNALRFDRSVYKRSMQQYIQSVIGGASAPTSQTESNPPACI